LENFTWHNGKVFNFWRRTGEVISTNKMSETHISSSGGGGHVDPQYGGHVAAAQISSTVITTHEFWLKEEDGTERAVQLRGKNIPLAVGQKVTLIAGSVLGEDQGYYVVLYNHNAKKHWLIQDGWSFYSCHVPETTEFMMGVKLGAVVISALLSWYYISGYLAIAIVAWSVYILASKIMKNDKSSKALDALFEKMARELSVAKQA